ncbi:hypothetical protein ACFVHW_04415 [Streptomyces sp. NPDC127110]|uniref:hypothetical protein n=1 Tax=Streptomyces sp. NPDC127110 TaxID=3345362 RepID=UPI00362F2EAB
MTAVESFTAWRSGLLQQLLKARTRSDAATAEQITDELRAGHAALGELRAGTREEQNTYLFARHTSTPLPELLAFGIDTNSWPTLPQSPRLAEPPPVPPETQHRISAMFESVGPLEAMAEGPRYQVRHRPQDGQVFCGQPLPWAIWDTREVMAIAYHPDRDLCEYQAAKASEAFSRRHGLE